ncbi:Inosose dehydratase [Chitinophaga sp. MM2321]
MNRRTFIQRAGVLGTGLMLAPSAAFSFHKQTGIQLYTLGDLGKDVKGGMQKVAAAGYKLVETSGYTDANKFWGLDAKAFRAVLTANNLQSPSGLYGIDLKGDFEDLKRFVEAAVTVGQKYIVMPWLFEEWRQNADDYKFLAHKLNEAGEITQQANLQMAYHNHDFEFKDFGGQTGYDILLKETDARLVKMEMDIYWIVRGGADPVALFKKHPGRFALWHVKDMDKTDLKLNTEIGTGRIDFKKIFASAGLAGLDYAFVEQENFKMDPYKSIAASAAYLSKELLK